jgi:capsular polysaccharide biosynthesis protein
MSLLLIMRKVWKYRLATLPIVLCVVVGAVYVIAIKPPVYEAAATYILVNPPPPPTQEQIARNPALGSVDADNPYTRFSDSSVLVQVLASRLNSEEGRRGLAARGADPNYTVAPSAEFGFSAPILQITGTGTNPAAAVNTANLVGLALTNELDRMQEIRSVNKEYRIKTEAVVAPHDAKLKASGKLRALVAVLALGTILLFIAISVLDAVSGVRAQWAQGAADDEGLWDGLVDDDKSSAGAPLEPPLALHPDSRDDPDPDEDAPQWPLEAKR